MNEIEINFSSLVESIVEKITSVGLPLLAEPICDALIFAFAEKLTGEDRDLLIGEIIRTVATAILEHERPDIAARTAACRSHYVC